MNAPVVIGDDSYRKSDRQFLRQLKIANRQQLAAMLETFTRLAPDGGPFAWKRAAVLRKLGVERTAFSFLARDEWWRQP